MNDQQLQLARLALQALSPKTQEALFKELLPLQHDSAQDKRLLTFAEVARILDLSRTTIWRMVKDGRLPSIETRVGRHRIPSAGVTAYLQEGAQ